MAKHSHKQKPDPRRDCPHAKIIGKWEAAGLDSSIAEPLRDLDAVHKLEPAHLERIRALFERAAGDTRWDVYGEGGPAPGERLFLDDALRALPPGEVLALFEQNDLFRLDERQKVFEFLMSRDTPFYTLSELAVTTQHALRCHERNRDYLVKFGYAMTDFQRCRRLSDLVSRLYCVRESHLLHRLRAYLVPPRVLRRLFPQDNLPEPHDWVFFADEANTPLVFTYRSWGTITDVPKADRVRLGQGRARLYRLKAKVLDLLERAVRSRCADGLWEKCFGLIADSITAEEAEFYLRVDRVYEGYDIRTGEVLDDEGGWITGGLTALVETIGHYEKELTIGSLCRSKEALESHGLAGLDTLGQGEVWTSVRERVRSYFDFCGDAQLHTLNTVLETFMELSEQEVKFWRDYTTRVNVYFEQELYEDIHIHKKVKRRFADAFRPQLAHVADWVAAQMELAGEIPVPMTGTEKAHEAMRWTESSALEGQPAGPTPPEDAGRKRKRRLKREVAESLVRDHLLGRPHDTAQEVANAVGCSVGVVAESAAWKANRIRLRTAEKEGRDPKAVELDVKTVSEAGGRLEAQRHEAEGRQQALDDEMDQRERELFKQIDEYQKEHPDTTLQQIAAAIGCTAGDIERRQAMLDKLTAEQDASAKEDAGGRLPDEAEPGVDLAQPKQWVRKRP